MKATMGKIKTYFFLYLKYFTAYKMNIIAKLFYMPINMFITGLIWYTLYKNNPSLIDLGYMLNYYLISFTITQIYPFARMARGMEDEIFKGNITNYLVRPVSHIIPKLSQFFAWCSIFLLMTMPIIIGIVIVNKIRLYNLLMFSIVLGIGLIINFLIWYSIGLLSFWMEKILGIVRAYGVIVSFCSGALIPLTLIKSDLAKILNILPFKYFVFLPINILLNNENTILEMNKNILIGIMWVIFMYIVSRILWSKGTLKYESNFH